MVNNVEVIESAKPEHMQQVLDLWLSVNIAAHDFVAADYWKDNYELVGQMLPQADIVVARRGDEITGFIGVAEGGYLAGLFVASEYQGQGIGGRLIGYCQERYPSLALHVFVKNKSAYAFYLKHGFAVVEEVSNEAVQEQEYQMVWAADVGEE